MPTDYDRLASVIKATDVDHHFRKVPHDLVWSLAMARIAAAEPGELSLREAFEDATREVVETMDAGDFGVIVATKPGEPVIHAWVACNFSDITLQFGR